MVRYIYHFLSELHPDGLISIGMILLNEQFSLFEDLGIHKGIAVIIVFTKLAL